MTDDVAYQNAAQVRQLQAERANAVAYGQATRVAAVDKQLAAFGITQAGESDQRPESEPEKSPPKARATKQERQQTTGTKAD